MVVRASLAGEDERTVRVRFVVTDTGIGIPKDRLGILFSPFSQVDASTTRKHGGTGLGLAISRQLAELMGGDIGVESEEGTGSTFAFEAVMEKQAPGREHVPEPVSGLQNTKVLVVDDNATNRLLVSTHLKSWGCRVEEAPEGNTALDLLREAARGGEPFEIALLDMRMPGMNGHELAGRIGGFPELAGTRLILLSSIGQCGDSEQLERLGFSVCLSKPIRKVRLRESLAVAMGWELPSRGDGLTDGGTCGGAGLVVRADTRVLVAEDNYTNQKVVQAILKKLGCHADVVGNGREAVIALEQLPYDLVLMDCQMPEMDGYEATARIRDPRSKVLNHRVPIIALTAHAMQSDRERCLSAGMDDHLTKPIRPAELEKILERWVAGGKGAGEGTPVTGEPVPGDPDEQADGDAVFDEKSLLQCLMGDRDLMLAIAGGFLQDLPRQLAALRSALDASDRDEVRRLAHTIKGSAANLSASRLREAAHEMERAAATEPMDAVRRMFTDLSRRFDLLADILKRKFQIRANGEAGPDLRDSVS